MTILMQYKILGRVPTLLKRGYQYAQLKDSGHNGIQV